MAFEIGSRSDVGRQRGNNEDAFAIAPLPSGILCIVADGMGGHQAGEVASRLAVETIQEAVARAGGDPAALVEAVQAAHRAIRQAGVADPTKTGMGTTVVCALLRDGQAHLVSVGDSPAFLLRGSQVSQVTRDHSLVGEALARGELTPAQAATHPYRHVLTRCLGQPEPLEVESYPPLELVVGDTLVLCTDGLTEHVASDELPALIADRPAQQAAEALVELANARGGVDNITVIVARRAASSGAA